MAHEPAVSGYAAPPRPNNRAGEVRKVGLELELAGISVERALELVAKCFGGEVVLEKRTRGTVHGTRFGTFKVEYDSRALQNQSYLKPLAALGLDADSMAAQLVEESVLQVAGELVPIEIITPPWPWTELSGLDPLWSALRAAGAEDTHSSLFYAFGLHLNPETPDREHTTVLSFLRAFLLLEDWIVESGDVDIARRIAPFIRPFPEAYRRKVLAPSYAPGAEQLLADYLESNPTRNRGLDFLPLFVDLYGDAFLKDVEDAGLVKGRPTFHYRLPNCELVSPDWSPRADWNRWVAIERLAHDQALLEELSRAYLETYDLPLRLQSIGWIAALRERVSLPGEVRPDKTLGA